MKLAVLILLIASPYIVFAQSFNTYGNLYDLFSANETQIGNTNVENEYSSLTLNYSFGLAYLKNKNITYGEVLLSSSTKASKSGVIDSEDYNMSEFPSRYSYGVLIGRGKYIVKNDKISLITSVFFNANLRSLGVRQINTLKTGSNNPALYTLRVYSYEAPNQLRLNLGFRLGIQYNITPRLFTILNFDFIGGFIKEYGDIKETVKIYNYYDLTQESTIVKSINTHIFRTDYFIPVITLGYNIWKYRYHR